MQNIYIGDLKQPLNQKADVIFEDSTSDFDLNIIKDNINDDCVAFILSNEPNIKSIIQKYTLMGFKFHAILIYSKKYSMIKSYKPSKLFVYVFTKGKVAICNQNIYGLNKVPVLSQKDIYKDLLLRNPFANKTVLDLTPKTSIKAEICNSNNINYISAFCDVEKMNFYNQLLCFAAH